MMMMMRKSVSSSAPSLFLATLLLASSSTRTTTLPWVSAEDQQAVCASFRDVATDASTAEALKGVRRIVLSPMCPASGDFDMPSRLHWHVSTSLAAAAATDDANVTLTATDPTIVTPTVVDDQSTLTFAFDPAWTPERLGVTEIAVGSGVEIVLTPGQVLETVETDGTHAVVSVRDAAGTVVAVTDAGDDNRLIVESDTTGSLTVSQTGTRSAVVVRAPRAAVVVVDIAGTENDARVVAPTVTGRIVGTDNRLLVVGAVGADGISSSDDGIGNRVLVNNNGADAAEACAAVDAGRLDEECAATNETAVVQDLDCQGPTRTNKCTYNLPSSAGGGGHLTVTAITSAMLLVVWASC